MTKEQTKYIAQKKLQLTDCLKQIKYFKNELKAYEIDKKTLESEIFLAENGLEIGQDLVMPENKRAKLVEVENSWGMFLIVTYYSKRGVLLNATKRLYKPVQEIVLSLNKKK